MSAAPVTPPPSQALPWPTTPGLVVLSSRRCSRCGLPLPVLDVDEGHTTHGACVRPPVDITTARRRRR